MSKTLEIRLSEIKTLYKHLADLGLSEDMCPEIKEFKILCNDFVKNGHGSSGKIRLREIGRDMIYVLSMQSHITSYVTLKTK